MERSANIKTFIKIVVLVLHYRGSPAYTVKEVKGLVGRNVTLSCLIAVPVQMDHVTVEWYMVDGQSDKHPVYTVEDGKARVYREGRVVDHAGLSEGNASLQLHRLTVRDEGRYTCRVITPVVHLESTILEVSAQPSVFLPETATVTEGEDKTLQCDITGFYPADLDVTWYIQNGSHLVHAGMVHRSRVCTEMAVLNLDGTYSIRSGITVHSSAVEYRETNVICQVEHKTYLRPYNKSVRLIVQAPSVPSYDAVSLIAAGSVSTLLLVVIVLTAIYLFSPYGHTGPTSVSDILKPSVIYARVPTELKVIIKTKRQVTRELKVKWYKIATNQNLSSVSNGQLESAPLLAREDVSDQATLLYEHMQYVSTLPVCLTVREDPSAYQCVVLYRRKKFSRETNVSVKVQPSFLQITSIPQIPQAERQLVLCCRVEKFYPEVVRLEWSRNDGEPVDAATNFGPFSDQERLYSVWSKIQLVMAREDERVVYTCRLYHSSFPGLGYKDVLYHINTQGTFPSVMFIKCEPPCPRAGEECTLNLCIRDFCPKETSVTWLRNGERVAVGVFNTPPSLNVNGLYSMWSFVKLTPSIEDQGTEFRCRVVHSANVEYEERVYTLPPLHVTASGCE